MLQARFSSAEEILSFIENLARVEGLSGIVKLQLTDDERQLLSSKMGRDVDILQASPVLMVNLNPNKFGKKKEK